MKTLARILALALVASCTSVARITERERELVSRELRARVEPLSTDLEQARARELLGQPIGRKEAVAIALALAPEARRALAELDVASAARARAELARNPLAQLEVLRLGGDTDVDFDLTQPLAELITRRARLERADAELRAERYRAARALVRLAHDVRREWLEAVGAAQAAKLAEERFEAEAAATRLAEELHSAGNLVESALSLSRVALAKARETASAARLRSALALASLARRLGAPDARIELDTDELREAPELELDALAEQAEASSLELREARSRVDAAAHAAGFAGREALLERSSAGLSVARDDGRSGAGLTLGLALPLFGGAEVARAQARAQLELELEQLEALTLDLRERSLSLTQRYAAAADRHRAAAEELEPAARRFVDDTLRQYNAMQIGVFDVLAARRIELDAQEQLLARALELQRIAADVDELRAGSLPDEPALVTALE